MLQCARALEFAHENQIVHRDVKPDNIMLSKEGIVKIADLGIAKTFEESEPSTKEPRRVMGTPHYMAPEQALGKTIDHRVDIYSLGATFYHLIVGNTPFTGSTAHEILRAHIQESLPAIQDSNADIPDPVCFIIERMMAKLPEKRYASMSKVIEDIELVQKGIMTGIDRIDAGDSTILRTNKNAKEGRAKKADQIPTCGPINKVAIGTQQTPLARMSLALALTAVFAATVAVVVIFAQKFSGNPSDINQKDVSPDHKTIITIPTPANTDTTDRGNTDAKKLLNAAQQANNEADYEKNLTEVVRKYPASLEAEDANKKLAELAEQRKEAARQRAQTVLNDAKLFETANPDKLTECIAKYEQVIAASQNFPAILDPAKIRHDDLKKRLADQSAHQLEVAFQLVSETAKANKNKSDYDTARAALQDFIAQNASAPQKNLAQQLLDQLNVEAQARFKKARDDASMLDFAAALALWNTYTLQIKDSITINDVKTAGDAIKDKARVLFDDEMKKAGDKARQFDYKSALDIIRPLQLRLAGAIPTDALKTREDDFKKQKELYDRVIIAIKEGLKNGPIILSFEINLPLSKKWKIVSIEAMPPSYIFKLDAISGPGISRRLDQLTPREQYDLFLQFLPAKLTAENHKALEAFCRERELTKEAEAHEGKALGNTP
ncbi:MAG: protein kinase [Planctomycetota bacterium]